MVIFHEEHLICGFSWNHDIKRGIHFHCFFTENVVFFSNLMIRDIVFGLTFTGYIHQDKFSEWINVVCRSIYKKISRFPHLSSFPWSYILIRWKYCQLSFSLSCVGLLIKLHSYTSGTNTPQTQIIKFPWSYDIILRIWWQSLILLFMVF